MPVARVKYLHCLYLRNTLIWRYYMFVSSVIFPVWYVVPWVLAYLVLANQNKKRNGRHGKDKKKDTKPLHFDGFSKINNFNSVVVAGKCREWHEVQLRGVCG